MKPSTHQQVLSLIAQAAQRESACIHPHDHLIEDLNLDALELAELVALLRQAFHIPAGGICEPGCLTVHQVVQRVDQQIRRKAA